MMSDFLLASLCPGLESNTDQGKTKRSISQEESHPGNSDMDMDMKYNMATGFEYNACDNQSNVSVEITLRNDVPNVPIIRGTYYVYLEDVERRTFHWNGLSGQHCNTNTGTIKFDYEDTDGLIYNQPLSFSAQIIEREAEHVQTSFSNFANMLRANDHLELFELLEPHLAMSFFVRFKCLFVYQTDGDLGWQHIEAESEAFIYKPLPPRVISVLQPPVAVADDGALTKTVVLNRALIPGYDDLRAVVLENSFGDAAEFDRSWLNPNLDRIDVDLSGHPTFAAAAGTIRPSAVRLLGSSGGGSHEWPPKPPPPSKPERQRRVFNPDELDETF